MAWNGSNSAKAEETQKAQVEAPKSVPASPRRSKGLLAGLLVVVLALAALWFVMRRQDAPTPEKPRQPKSSEDYTPIKIATTNRVVKTEVDARLFTNAVGEVLSIDQLPKTVTGEPYVDKTETTNSSGVVEVMYTLPDGKKKGATILQSKESLVFDNDFDLMLGIIGTTPLDQTLPPFPPGMESDYEAAFEKAIQTPIIIRDTDNEKARELKEAAMIARQQIADLRAEGYTVAQILGEANSLREANVKYRGEFQQQLNQIYREQGEDAAKLYMENANPKLEEMGIVPLVMPGQGTRKIRRK